MKKLKEFFESKSVKKNQNYAIGIGIGTCFIAMLLIEEIFLGTAVGVIAFFSTIVFFYFYPKLKKKQKAELIEKDLPFALMQLAVELNLNISFEKALENAGNQRYGLLSRELKKIVLEIKNDGSSVQEALFHFSERINSLMIKRTVSQLISIYEQGGKEKGSGIKSLAKEILAKQKAESKEFGGKLIVYSLMFIAFSAIIPAIFQAFIVIGSMFLELDFTAMQIFLIIAMGFPAIDIAILLFIKLKTPVFLRD